VKFFFVFVEKAMLDGRLLDIPLSALFWRMMLGETLVLADLAQVYPEAFAVLAELAKGNNAKYPLFFFVLVWLFS
jgi:hypothetical protein